MRKRLRKKTFKPKNLKEYLRFISRIVRRNPSPFQWKHNGGRLVLEVKLVGDIQEDLGVDSENGFS